VLRQLSHFILYFGGLSRWLHGLLRGRLSLLC
jgi:hypothetical protein